MTKVGTCICFHNLAKGELIIIMFQSDLTLPVPNLFASRYIMAHSRKLSMGNRESRNRGDLSDYSELQWSAVANSGG